MIAAHRAFLQEGYERGDFLISGPTVPPTGGFGRVSEKVSHGSGGVVLLRATAIGGQWLA
jgi:uncharacterized protein YciI